MVDLDDISTYPEDIRQWVIKRKNYFLKNIPLNLNEEDFKILRELRDVRIDETPEFLALQKKYYDTEFTGWHFTRIENLEDFCKQGILKIRDIDDGIKRLNFYLNKKIKIDDDKYRLIIKQAKFYWKTHSGRIGNVCFFLTKDYTIGNPQAMMFAANLGGEILRWSIDELDSKAYRQEPYKRLWIWGEPYRVKFKVKLKEMETQTQTYIIRELVFYFIMKDIYGCTYNLADTGEKRGDVPPDDILRIEKIENFENIMSQYAEFEDFY